MGDTETQSLFEQVGQYLQELDLDFDSSEGEGCIGVYDGEHMSWRIIIHTDLEPELRRIQVTSLLPVKAPINTREPLIYSSSPQKRGTSAFI